MTESGGCNRREFIKAAGLAGVGAALGLPAGGVGAAEKYHVVVIGGGAGGATAARYLRKYDPDRVRVTLVEPKKQYHTCFGGNWYLGGFADMADLSHGYKALDRGNGLRVVHDTAEEVDPENRKVRLSGGSMLAYDRLVMAPGIDFRWEEVDGMGPADAEQVPHAWKGGEQYRILRRQLEAMDDGGTVAICPPANPFRCPPGPYERVSLIAHYLKQNKPRSKVLVLDAKDSFSKQGLFQEGWRQLYGDRIEWVPGSEGGLVSRVEPQAGKVFTQEGFQEHTPDVLNFIPPQRAAAIARRADLADRTGWCPVNQKTFESERHPGIHVIGDAAIAGAMPKSGHSANNQGKMVAAAIVSLVHGTAVPEPSMANTCYSLIGPEYGISVAAVYRHRGGKLVSVEGAGGVSPAEADAFFRMREARFTRGWYQAITQDIFG